ncbi:MAG: CBU_0592 family membrane protein [Acidimicrobiia bacterium]
MEQVVQLVGAVLILGAFVAAQQRRMQTDSVPYLALNTLGAGILAVLAAMDADLGFLLLEGVWTLVSAYGLGRALSGRARARQGDPV